MDSHRLVSRKFPCYRGNVHTSTRPRGDPLPLSLPLVHDDHNRTHQPALPAVQYSHRPVNMSSLRISGKGKPLEPSESSYRNMGIEKIVYAGETCNCCHITQKDGKPSMSLCSGCKHVYYCVRRLRSTWRSCCLTALVEREVSARELARPQGPL